MGQATARDNFWERTRAAGKVMVLDLGFLGDTVHLLPALWMVRQAYPQAQLHVIVAEHVRSLMEVVPWVNCVWGYPRFPKHASLAENIRTVRRLRQERFDVVINLNGSDRSSWLTWLSGARERLGRRPLDGGPWLWRSMFTQVVEREFFEEPAYLQKWHCLRKAGFPGREPEFHVSIPTEHLAGAGFEPREARTYFHLSPFTTDDAKELPLPQMAELIRAVQEAFPAMKLVLSCAPTERERGKMDGLLEKLSQPPWRVLAGNLRLVQLAAVIQQSALHLSGDTGPLHLALMAGVPSLSWFRPIRGMKAWIPMGPRHRTINGTSFDFQGIQGIRTADLVEAAKELIGR